MERGKKKREAKLVEKQHWGWGGKVTYDCRIVLVANGVRMKQIGLVLVAIVLALGSIGLQFWKKPPKIGYAETSVLLSEFSEAIQARKEFEAAQKEWDKNLKILNDSLMAGMETMKRDFDKASQAQKEAMKTTFQKRNDDLQRYTNAIKKKSMEKEKELMEPVIKKVNSYLDLWGKQHHYDLILGTMSGGNILQANANMNVTSEVLKDLNQMYHDLPEISTKTEPPVAK